jgi:hypothetical protein
MWWRSLEGRGAAVADRKDFDINDGVRPGMTSGESDELRELGRRNRTLEQGNEILRRRGVLRWSRKVPPLFPRGEPGKHYRAVVKAPMVAAFSGLAIVQAK